MVKLYVGDVMHYASEYAGKIDIKSIKQRLNDLKKPISRTKKYRQYYNYLTKILHWLDNGLLNAPPSILNQIIKDFSSLTIDMSFNIFNGIPFYKSIITAMEYDKVRDIYRKYVPKIGIKTCVYCNAQYAITFTNTSNKEYAQFEIDHWKAKSRFPFLCISFFNFVPSCPSCNKHKGDDDLEYSLYTEIPHHINEEEYDPFVFRIPDVNLAIFLNSYQSDILKLEFKSKSHNIKMENDYKRFAINEMYQLFIDEAALFILRFLFYNNAYRKQLESSFRPLFKSGISYDEFIYGTSFRPGDTFRRPLSKMIRDLHTQLEPSIEHVMWLKEKVG